MDQINAQGGSTAEADGSKPQARNSNRWPDFFTIGAAKSGTTTLHSYLSRHPSLWMSEVKEPRFFCPGQPTHVGDPESYHKLFEGASETQLCGESSVDYSMWPSVPDVPRNIHAVVPHARFIYLVRDPVKRCYSHFVYRHSRILFRGQPFQRSFEEHAEIDPRVIQASDYASQIQRYLEFFPKESLLLLSFERFCEEPESALRKVFEFLGVEDRSKELASEPLHDNAIGDFTSRMRRGRVLAPFHRVPGLRYIYRSLPSSLRDKSISLIENSFLGRRDKRRFAPPPFPLDVQKRLRERFAASTEYLEREFGFDAGLWTQEPA